MPNSSVSSIQVCLKWTKISVTQNNNVNTHPPSLSLILIDAPRGVVLQTFCVTVRADL